MDGAGGGRAVVCLCARFECVCVCVCAGTEQRGKRRQIPNLDTIIDTHANTTHTSSVRTFRTHCDLFLEP